jgi:two-component system cell cycle sensor histidine kinase/response regulator CckA
MPDIQPKTVRVPPDLAPLFAKAEEVVSGYFKARVDRPEEGTIEVYGQRYILVRAASLSVEFFDLVGELYGPGREVEAQTFARNLLYDLAHAVGRSDARNFQSKMGLEDPVAKLSAGPIHFAHTGWAFVDILPESRPSADQDYYLVYEHPYSFESEAWIAAGRRCESPVCIMNAGYSSGWCEASFGMPLVATELLCRAKGDACCRFIMAPPARMESHLGAYKAARPELAHRLAGLEIPDFFSRKRLEEELRKAKQELEDRVAARTRELEDLHSQIRQSQKLEALGRLAGGVSHDFNNLLTAMLGFANLAEQQLDPDHPAQKSLLQMQEAALRAAALTRQLLAFSRRQVLQKEVVDLHALIRGMTEMLGPVLGGEISLRLDLRDPEACFIEADRSQMEQVILNLALNARDAMPRDGLLRIACYALQERGSSWVCLEVEDNGFGMDEVVQSQLFEPFFTTKPKGEGTGLGLSTVYGIIQQSGGHIAVDSQPGRGACFRILLPRCEVAPPAATSVPVTPKHEGNGTVLVVEDEGAVREAVVRILMLRGFEVLDSGDPLKALEIAQNHPGEIHLLLTDMVMPHLNGRELAARFRHLRPEATVLYMSGYTEQELGPDDIRRFLPKPFTRAALLEKVQEALGAAANKAGER